MRKKKKRMRMHICWDQWFQIYSVSSNIHYSWTICYGGWAVFHVYFIFVSCNRGETQIKQLSCLITKPTKWHVRPAKTQISLGIRPVWSIAVRMKKAWVLSYPLSTQRRLWSDWADAQADLSSLGAHAILLVLSWGSSVVSCIFIDHCCSRTD